MCKTKNFGLLSEIERISLVKTQSTFDWEERSRLRTASTITSTPAAAHAVTIAANWARVPLLD